MLCFFAALPSLLLCFLPEPVPVFLSPQKVLSPPILSPRPVPPCPAHGRAPCENEAANLIFSAFADRAAKAGVQFTVQAGISQALPVSESDLCVLLSNALAKQQL